MRIRNNAGFSLGELITIMGIIMVLAAIAIPNFIDWRSKRQVSRAARDVYSSLQKAKVEAVRRNQICGVWFRNGPNNYVIYVDTGGTLYQFDAGVDDVIKTVPWSDYPGVNFNWNFANPIDGIAFASDGMPRNSANNLASGSVSLTGPAGVRQNTISITPAGSIQIN